MDTVIAWRFASLCKDADSVRSPLCPVYAQVDLSINRQHGHIEGFEDRVRRTRLACINIPVHGDIYQSVCASHEHKPGNRSLRWFAGGFDILKLWFQSFKILVTVRCDLIDSILNDGVLIKQFDDLNRFLNRSTDPVLDLSNQSLYPLIPFFFFFFRDCHDPQFI